MSSGNGPPRPYSVSVSQVQRAKLVQLHHEQDDLGRGAEFVDSYRTALRRL